MRMKLKGEGSSDGCSHREGQGDQHTRSGAEDRRQLEVDESGEEKAFQRRSVQEVGTVVQVQR
jgi:hypothetical protein